MEDLFDFISTIFDTLSLILERTIDIFSSIFSILGNSVTMVSQSIALGPPFLTAAFAIIFFLLTVSFVLRVITMILF